MKGDLRNYEKILELWEEKEEWLRFSEIVRKLGWYAKKVNRYLDSMVEIKLLQKRNKGVK